MELVWVISLSSALASSALPVERKGCPENALCTKKAGLLRHSWETALKKSRNLEVFRKNHGLPLEVWTHHDTDMAKAGDDRIHYDSPCDIHKNRYKLTEIFSPNFGPLRKQKGIILHQALLLPSRKKKPVHYFLPRGDVPLHASRGRLFFNRHFEGHYYGISVGRSGDVRAEKTIARSANLVKHAKCPHKLSESFHRLKHPPNLYAQSYCLAVPDLRTNAYHTLILGWSCP